MFSDFIIRHVLRSEMLDLLLVVVVFAVDFLLIISFAVDLLDVMLSENTDVSHTLIKVLFFLDFFITSLNLCIIQLILFLASSVSLLFPFVSFGNRHGEFIKLFIITLGLVSVLNRLCFLFFKRIITLLLTEDRSWLDGTPVYLHHGRIGSQLVLEHISAIPI